LSSNFMKCYMNGNTPIKQIQHNIKKRIQGHFQEVNKNNMNGNIHWKILGELYFLNKF
jgi:hypothetical protein